MKLPIPFPHYGKKLPKFYLLKILCSKESRAKKKKKKIYIYIWNTGKKEFAWAGPSILLMISLGDVQKWEKLSILKNISIIKKIIALEVFNTGLEIRS